MNIASLIAVLMNFLVMLLAFAVQSEPVGTVYLSLLLLTLGSLGQEMYAQDIVDVETKTATVIWRLSSILTLAGISIPLMLIIRLMLI